MPQYSPQQVGEKQAKLFLRNHDVTREAFMKEGEGLAKQHSDEYAQKGYLKGWEKAWPQEEKSAEKVILELDSEQFAEMESLLQDRVSQLLQGEPGTYRGEKLQIARSIIGQFPARKDRVV
jgi:hypothetical protein